MPQNKRQHYVPRAYLKPFSANREGVAIHLYNLKADKAIPNAPLKSQCARDYFYGLVYTIRDKAGISLEVGKASDVETLNELVALNCSQNLYFAEGDGDNARKRLAAVGDRRCERSQLRVFVSLGKKGTREDFRLATEEEKKGKGPFMMQSINVYPVPRQWPSFLRYRDPLRMFSNGSAIGYVRNEEWLRKAA